MNHVDVYERWLSREKWRGISYKVVANFINELKSVRLCWKFYFNNSFGSFETKNYDVIDYSCDEMMFIFLINWGCFRWRVVALRCWRNFGCFGSTWHRADLSGLWSEMERGSIVRFHQGSSKILFSLTFFIFTSCCI